MIAAPETSHPTQDFISDGASPVDMAAADDDDPNGAKAESGSMRSGFGGLWLEGIVGSPSAEPLLGEGNTGIISGDKAGGSAGNLGVSG